ncbi:MAG: hypothetical protein LRY31_04555 [Burkholderiaceae bacterium]|nr:hypothetical protein [Burkholderiaceae bacterium]
MTEAQRPASTQPPRLAGPSSALTIALVYAAFGALWILLSDTLLLWLLEDRELLLVLSTAKGWLFVFLSALLVFFVAMRFHRPGGVSATLPGWQGKTPWLAFGVITLAIATVSVTHVVHGLEA